MRDMSTTSSTNNHNPVFLGPIRICPFDGRLPEPNHNPVFLGPIRICPFDGRLPEPVFLINSHARGQGVDS